MSALVLINGAPGSGKSTIAHRVAQNRRLALALDIDAIRHNLGHWDVDLHASGLQARALALAVARRHLVDGHDVIVGQYLARTGFIEELEAVAARCSARFVEIMLDLDPQHAQPAPCRSPPSPRPSRARHQQRARLAC